MGRFSSSVTLTLSTVLVLLLVSSGYSALKRNRLDDSSDEMAVNLGRTTYTSGQDAFSEPDFDWLGQQVFRNECRSRPACLTSWNAGEDFPSLGIGHFIWYRAGQQEIFEESFPQLLSFLKRRQVALPPWLQNSADPDNPWPSRAAFNAAQQSEQMRELRAFLLATAPLQAEFIVSRFNLTEDEIIFSFPPADRSKARQILQGLAAAHPPLGQYALIDYLHFKGSGLNPAERYHNIGWGLKQVVAEMLEAEVSLQQFVKAGTAVLDRRISNAPAERRESRWRAGWHNRLQSYLPPAN